MLNCLTALPVTRSISLAEVCGIAWTHPLPGGNKRAAGACLVMFLDLNGARWVPNRPDVDEAESAVLAVAAGSVDEACRVASGKSRILADEN
jgi:death on curing protein